MLISQRPTLSEEVVAENRSKFTIEPLEPGFGYTIGNSLRRTLLSSIPGAAVTSIRIEGVLHEFTTVPGVKEDVTDIILNLKGLVVSSTEDEPVTMYVKKQGPGVITAAGEQCPDRASDSVKTLDLREVVFFSPSPRFFLAQVLLFIALYLRIRNSVFGI